MSEHQFPRNETPKRINELMATWQKSKGAVIVIIAHDDKLDTVVDTAGPQEAINMLAAVIQEIGKNNN